LKSPWIVVYNTQDSLDFDQDPVTHILRTIPTLKAIHYLSYPDICEHFPLDDLDIREKLLANIPRAGHEKHDHGPAEGEHGENCTCASEES
jgi:hypothetical protein